MRPNEAADFSGCTNRSFFRTQALLITSLQVLTIPHRPHTQKIASRGKTKKMGWLADRMIGLKIRMGQKPAGVRFPLRHPPAPANLCVLNNLRFCLAGLRRANHLSKPHTVVKL